MPRPEGPFDRLLRRNQRDPAPFIIGGTVVFLAVVILLVFLLSGVFGGGEDGDTTTVGDSGVEAKFSEMPSLPPGLVALSDFVEFGADGDLSATIALPLRSQPEDESGLGFYTYEDGRWQRVASARLDGGGQRAEADFSPLPANLAVLRVVAQAYQVAASLPPGGRLHPEAQAGIVSPRDYKPLGDGTLEGTATEVEAGADVLLIPTIVGSGEDTAAVVNDILADDSLREQHLMEIVQLAESGSFAGIDLEYSSVDPELRSEFTEFAQELGRALREDGRRLSLTLPPPGPQRQAYDWPVLGQAVDIIKVLPIADPLDYWETMTEGMNQLVEDVDPQKVMLVVSPFSSELAEGGSSRTLGYLEAMLLASEIKVRDPTDPAQIEIDVGVTVVAVNLAQSEGASDLRWSDEAAAVSFSYQAPDRRTVYIENVFSARFKLEIVQTYALGGVSVSDASARSDAANIWPAVNELVETGTITLVRPNGDALVPRWEAPDGGRLDATAGPSVIWRAEEAGSYKLRMLISDGDGRFGRELTVEVQAERTDDPTPLLTFGPEATATATPSPTPTAEPIATPTPTPAATPNAAPAAPTNLAADDGPGANKITLTWDGNAESDLSLYRIYRGESLGGPYPLPVATVSTPTTTFIDSGLTSGKTYYYVITAEDTDGNESSVSNEAFDTAN